MKLTRILYWITGIYEGILGIPVLGGFLVWASSWSFLLYALIAHIVTLIVCARSKRSIHGSIIGICASILGWIPFLGWTLHVLAAVFLIISAVKSRQ